MKRTLCLCSILSTLLLFFLSSPAGYAQFSDGVSGLLSMPSAEMHRDGTFTITNNFLNKHQLSDRRWGYNTFSYSFGITFWSRLEIGYVLTILDGKRSPKPNPIFFNQDRHFNAKFLLLREGDFGQDWVPALAVGVSDPVTGASTGNYWGSQVDGGSTGYGNGYFNRYFVVSAKHFNTGIGSIGAHLGYQFSYRRDRPMNGPCAAVTWRPVWIQNDWVALNLIAEYDARTINVGFITSIWKDHFEAMFELQDLKWITAGLRYKLVLKH